MRCRAAAWRALRGVLDVTGQPVDGSAGLAALREDLLLAVDELLLYALMAFAQFGQFVPEFLH